MKGMTISNIFSLSSKNDSAYATCSAYLRADVLTRFVYSYPPEIKPIIK